MLFQVIPSSLAQPGRHRGRQVCREASLCSQEPLCTSNNPVVVRPVCPGGVRSGSQVLVPYQVGMSCLSPDRESNCLET